MKTLKEAIISRLVEGDDKIGDTIIVDGVSRPTKNSEGKLIHPTKQGIENFWKWFGDSKVVDKNGRPLVVYHGTAAEFDTFEPTKPNFYSFTEGVYFFVKEKGVAENFGKNVMPVYLSIDNPTYLDGKNAARFNTWDLHDDEGNYGWIVEDSDTGGGITTEYAVENPNQIKSAIGNNGDFNVKSNKINESKNKYYIIDDEDVSVQMDFNLKVTYDEETGEFDVIDLATNQEFPFGATTSQWNQMKDAVKKSGKKSTTVKMTLDVPLLASIYEEEGSHDIEFKDSETNEDYTSRVPKTENERVFWKLFKRYEKERKQSDEDDQAFDAVFYK